MDHAHPPTWQYTAVSWHAGDNMEQLNALGLQGWELVGVTRDDGASVAYLKRTASTPQDTLQGNAMPHLEPAVQPDPARPPGPRPEPQDVPLPTLHPGEIWLVTVPAAQNGSATMGRRPVIVLETDQNLAYVVPLTSHVGRGGVYLPPGSGNDLPSVALTGQLRALQGNAFIRAVGRVSERVLTEIENEVDEKANEGTKRR